MFPNIIDIILIARCQRDLAEHESEPYSELSTQFRHRGMLPVPGDLQNCDNKEKKGWLSCSEER